MAVELRVQYTLPGAYSDQQPNNYQCCDLHAGHWVCDVLAVKTAEWHIENYQETVVNL
jgi:hypothetical protein